MTVGRAVLNHAWPPERVVQLLRMWAQGHSAESIAAEIGGGLTRCAVLGKVHRLRHTLGNGAFPSRVRSSRTTTRRTRPKHCAPSKPVALSNPLSSYKVPHDGRS